MALVTNSSYVDEIPFDGVRRHLAQDFDAVYLLDLGGNVRKNPKLSGTTHNVFGIQVGVCVALFVRTTASRLAHRVLYARLDEFARKESKYEFLEGNTFHATKLRELSPDAAHRWLHDPKTGSFAELLPIGMKETKSGSSDSGAIFANYSRGAETTRDDWMYNFRRDALTSNVKQFVQNYNDAVAKWHSEPNADKRKLEYDDTKVKWSSSLMQFLERNRRATYDDSEVRKSKYRPFTEQYVYFDEVLLHRRGQIPKFFPTAATEENNIAITATSHSQLPFSCYVVQQIPCLDVGGRPTQCFPFYTYDEDGTNRRENITDWALEQFRSHYSDKSITKWDIFHYVYAVLHHPEYRERYAANLRRELPRIPFVPGNSGAKDTDVFRAFVKTGKRLAEIHVHYEKQPEYKLKKIEKPGKKLDYSVTKMRLSKDKTQIVYNDFLTLSGVPPETFEYRLGNRSALDWVIDQYQVSTDKRSGITNDPNRADDPQYILRLVGQVITVSLETVKLVKSLPPLLISGKASPESAL